jgi:hypothetical protein
VATWSFTGLSAGQYRVSATWVPFPNRATNAPYQIREAAAGPVLATKAIDQQQAPNDLNDQGSFWEDLGVVTVQGSTLRVELTNAGANNYVIADAIRIERIGAVPVEPEIVAMSLTGNTPIVDNTGSVDFGDATVGAGVVRSFRIHNVGSTNLVVQPFTVPTGFFINANFGVNQTITPGSFFDIFVQLDTGSPGSFSGPLSFATNDADENPFNFTVMGDVFAAGEVPVVQIVDDGDAAFSVTGGPWETWPSGRGSDVRYTNIVGGTNYPSGAIAAAGTARWQFTSLPTGQYKVSATWPGADASLRATNAPFTIRDAIDGGILASASINQAPDPNDFSDQGSLWEDLGTVNITAGTLVVQLTNTGANNYVIADAIRIQRLGPPSGLEAGLSADLTADASSSTPAETTAAAPSSAVLALSTTPSSTPITTPADEDDAALSDLSAYSVPLDDISSGALYELWQSA